MLQQATPTLLCLASLLCLGIPGASSIENPSSREAERQTRTFSIPGVTYTCWGRDQCPSSHKVELVYDGIMAASRWSEGGSVGYSCLHKEPEFLEVVAGLQDYGRGFLYSTEYEARGSPPAFGDMLGHNAPCSVCYVTGRSSVITIPGRTSCPPSWTREYYGYFMADRSTGHSGMTPVCVDVEAQSIPDTDAHDSNSQLYFLETQCYGPMCPPYSEGSEVTCAVCSR